MRFQIFVALGLLSLVSCSRSSKDQPPDQNKTAQPSHMRRVAKSASSQFMLLGNDGQGHKYFAPVPDGINATNLHEGQELSGQDEKRVSDFMLGRDIQKGCCRVRVRWRVVVKKPSVTVHGTGVTVGSPSVTVGQPTVGASGWPEIRWNARSLIPNQDPPEYYDISTQCVNEGKGSTVYVVNNENKAVSVRFQAEGTDYDIYLGAHERRPADSWPDLSCAITAGKVIVYGSEKP